MTKEVEEKIVVDVTQYDIDNGKRTDCSSCPIARAISRKTGYEGKDVHVEDGFLLLLKHDPDYSDYYKYRIQLEKETAFKVSSFIASFDEGDKVVPFSFEGIYAESDPRDPCDDATYDDGYYE